MKNFLKNLPIILWAAVFFVGLICFTALGNILTLVTFIAFMLVVLILAFVSRF